MVGEAHFRGNIRRSSGAGPSRCQGYDAASELNVGIWSTLPCPAQQASSISPSGIPKKVSAHLQKVFRLMRMIDGLN